MTEIALNPAANAALAPQTAFTVDLAMWASELSAAHTIGQALASTDFVPASMKTQAGGRPKELAQVAENVAACILAGKALGLDPMNSIQNIFVVHGRPAMYARTMAALVLAAGHELERVAATERSVVYRGRRAGKTEWQTFEWTIERATKAGYLTNKKYQTDPIAMLTAKCQAEAARVIAPDVLTGIAATSVEEVELEDLGESPTSGGAAAPALAAVRARRAAPCAATSRPQQSPPRPSPKRPGISRPSTTKQTRRTKPQTRRPANCPTSTRPNPSASSSPRQKPNLPRPLNRAARQGSRRRSAKP